MDGQSANVDSVINELVLERARDVRQRTERIRLETVDRPLARFSVHALIGGLLKPFTRLAQMSANE
jgi:hypothetical protein